MYAQLGNIRFEGLKGFNSFSHEKSVNFAQHDRINGKPRLQSVGDNLDTISFDMYLHASFTDPESDIETLTSYMSNKEVLPLILGNGRVLGSFVIPKITQVNEFTDASGNLISVTLSIELVEDYIHDKLKVAKTQAYNKAFATSARNSNVRTVLDPKLSAGMGVTAEVYNIETSANLTSMHVDKIAETPSRSEYWSGKIQTTLTDIEGSLTNVQSMLSQASELQDTAQNAGEAINDVYVRVQNIKAVLPVSDVNDFKVLNQQLNGSVLNLKSSTIGVSNNSIIRRV